MYINKCVQSEVRRLIYVYVDTPMTISCIYLNIRALAMAIFTCGTHAHLLECHTFDPSGALPYLQQIGAENPPNYNKTANRPKRPTNHLRPNLITTQKTKKICRDPHTK